MIYNRSSFFLIYRACYHIMSFSKRLFRSVELRIQINWSFCLLFIIIDNKFNLTWFWGAGWTRRLRGDWQITRNWFNWLFRGWRRHIFDFFYCILRWYCIFLKRGSVTIINHIKLFCYWFLAKCRFFKLHLQSVRFETTLQTIRIQYFFDRW